MSSNESEDFEDPETEQTQVYQSDQDEMHFYQDEKLKDVGSAESVVAKNRARSGRDRPSDDEYFLIILFIRIYWTLFFKWCNQLLHKIYSDV